MKKGIGLLVILLVLLFCAAAAADTVIDADAFPDEIFRDYVSRNLDRDGDGTLSDGELKAVIGKGTLHYTGPDAMCGHSLTFAAGNKNAAIVQNDNSLPATVYIRLNFTSDWLGSTIRRSVASPPVSRTGPSGSVPPLVTEIVHSPPSCRKVISIRSAPACL